MMDFCSKILRNECGLNASTASSATQTAFFSISPSLEAKATETEYDSSKEEHALRLMEAESLVAQLRAENLAQKNEVKSVRTCVLGRLSDSATNLLAIKTLKTYCYPSSASGNKARDGQEHSDAV